MHIQVIHPLSRTGGTEALQLEDQSTVRIDSLLD